MADKKQMNEEDTIGRIKELYQSLSEDGKDEFLAQLVESEEFMGRILNILLKNENLSGSIDGIDPGFIEFLRKVKE